MKRIFQLSLLVLLLISTSCKFEEELIFDESSAVRLEKAKKEYFELLCSAPNGWVMEYFPTAESEGYTFVMQFYSSTEVKMATKANEAGSKFTRDSCLFEIIADNGPVLTFNTYSAKGVFHAFSDPLSDGVGLEGDYEFMFLKGDEQQIRLKGKKRGAYIVMRRMVDNKNWEEYFKDLDAIQSCLFEKSPNPIYLISGTDTLEASGGGSRIFKVFPKGGDPITDTEEIPFIITDYGLRFHAAYSINEQDVQQFVLSDDRNLLNCVNEGVTARFEAPDHTLFFGKDKVNKWNINTSLPMGSKFADLYDWLQNNWYQKEKLTDLNFNYIGYLDSYALSFKSSKNIGTFYFKKELIDANTVRIAYRDTCDLGGTTYLNRVPRFRELIDMLGQDYKVTPNPDGNLNFRKLGLEAKNDAEIRFYISL